MPLLASDTTGVAKVTPVEKWMSYTPHDLNSKLISFGGNLIATILIIFIGFWIANMISKAIGKIMVRRESDPGLTSFLTSGSSLAIKTLVILTGVNQIGIQTTSFIAVLGAAGLAIGMAFQGTLANLAGGVIILTLKPFRVGDEIEAQGVVGTVKQILIFHTFLTTGDNKVVIIPNAAISNSSIINYTRADKRRVDLRIRVSYGNNVHEFKEIALRIMNQSDLILKDPAPAVFLDELADGAIIFNVRAWTHTGSTTAVKSYLNEALYRQIPDAGISFPSSSMEVTLKNT